MNAIIRAPKLHVVVIGGGVTGAAVALHLASRHGANGVVISVVEPRAFLGGGLAYSSEEPSHRVNVPASRMSVVADEPEHFSRWLIAAGEAERDPDAVRDNGDVYPRRRVFGRYVEAQLEPHIARGHVRHEQALATRVEKRGAEWSVTLSDGRFLAARVVVLAATHPPPGIPAALSGLEGERGFVANPYDPTALADIAGNAAVLIVGTGLTSADTVAELDRRGHPGSIVALSRHGLRSRGHPGRRREPFGDFAARPARTTLGLLRDVRATVAAASAHGLTWHPVFDQLRAQGPAIWATLPAAERVRLVRRLRVFWDVHRFRIAPQVEAILELRAAEGTFASLAASLVDARREDGRFAVRLRRRGQRHAETLLVDAVVNTTGPAHHAALKDNPALRSLADAGHIRADAYGLGIDTSMDSRAVSASGHAQTTLFVAGPLARGTFGELMGLPEVAHHAQTVAGEVGALLDAKAQGRLLAGNDS